MAALSERDRESASLFVDEMKAARDQRGWPQAELADRAGYSESAVAMVETYQRPPTKTFAKAMDRAFGAPGTFERLERRLSAVPFPAAFRSFAPHEAEAIALYTFEHSFIPGLLQTEGYARAVLEMFPDVTEEIVSDRLAGRLSRQVILDRDDPPPPMVCALIDQSALLREIGGPKVMRDQLSHLVRMSRRPNIMIQVIPNAGAHPGLLGAFTVADVGGSPTIVNLEDIADGRVTEDADTVSMVTLRFHSLRGDALSKGASRDLIEGVIQDRWKDLTP